MLDDIWFLFCRAIYMFGLAFFLLLLIPIIFIEDVIYTIVDHWKEPKDR